MKTHCLPILASAVTSLVLVWPCSPVLGDTNDLDALKQQLEQVRQEQADLDQQEQALERQIATLDGQADVDAPSGDSGDQGQAAVTAPTPASDWKTSAHLMYYWDTRQYNTFSLQTSTTGLPLGFSIWGFIDLNGTQGQNDFDLTRYFLEYRLSREFDPDWVGGIKGLGFQAELNDSDGSGNNLVRFGLTYKHPLPKLFGARQGWLQWRGFAYETDGSGQQVSVVYYLPLHERVWISGFADLNFREGMSDIWVIEPQLNLKLDERFALLIEYRYNGFEDANNALKGHGVAFGLDVTF